MVLVPLGQIKMSKTRNDIKLANFTPMREKRIDHFFVMILENF